MENRSGRATERERVTGEVRQAADTASDKVQQAANTATDKAQHAADQASSFVKQTVDKAQHAADDLRSKDVSEVVDDARHKASEIVDTAKQKTAEASATAADKVDEAMTATGTQMHTLAQTVREKAPVEGKVGEVASTAADALDRGGRYLQDADLQVVRSDLERAIREHPVEALLVGLGVGYLLARATRR
jgi:vacuolar-type H+-ATPase subunit H